MKCPSCGMEVAAGKFCENCGAPLPVDEASFEPAPQPAPQPQPQPTAQMPMYTSPVQPQASSAPFVLAIIALVTALLGLFPISLVLAIIALAMNSGQKKRGEFSTKQTPALVMGIISLILSVLMAIFTIAIGGVVWTAVENGDYNISVGSTSSSRSGSPWDTASESPVGTWEVESIESDGDTYNFGYSDLMRDLGMEVELVVSSDGTARLSVLDEVEAGTWEDKGAGTIEFTFGGDSVPGEISGDEITLTHGSTKIVLHRTSTDSKTTTSSSASAV